MKVTYVLFTIAILGGSILAPIYGLVWLIPAAVLILGMIVIHLTEEKK